MRFTLNIPWTRFQVTLTVGRDLQGDGPGFVLGIDSGGCYAPVVAFLPRRKDGRCWLEGPTRSVVWCLLRSDCRPWAPWRVLWATRERGTWGQL